MVCLWGGARPADLLPQRIYEVHIMAYQSYLVRAVTKTQSTPPSRGKWRVGFRKQA